MSLASDTAHAFFELAFTVAPYLLIGAVAGAALQTFLSPARAERLIGPQRRRSLPQAIAAAAILPGCSCATMPMAAGLAGAGGPRLGTLSAFIFASPLLSPITVVLTWAMLGWEMTLARTVAALAGAMILGLLLNYLEVRWRAKRPPELLPIAGGAPTAAEAECGESTCEAETRPGFFASLGAILRKIVPYFLLGIAVAALLTALLPEDAIPSFLGDSAGAWAFLLAAAIGIPIYVCEGEEVPITFALVQHGLGQGPALTFLLGSVGTCVPTVLMSQSIIGRKATAVYLAFWFPFAIGAGILFQLAVG